MAPFESWSLVFQGVSVLTGLAQLGAIFWGIWIMRASNKSREAQTDMMIAQTRALEESTASLGEVVELSRAQRAEQQEQSAGIRALLERTT